MVLARKIRRMTNPRQRVIAAAMALTLSIGLTPMAAQQPQTGTIAGRATNEARRPYTNYVVQLRDAETAQIVATTPLNANGGYEFANVRIDQPHLVELYNVRDRQLICTEGPYALTERVVRRTDMNIDCGATPAALWLLAATTGAVSAIGLTTASPSQ